MKKLIIVLCTLFVLPLPVSAVLIVDETNAPPEARERQRTEEVVFSIQSTTTEGNVEGEAPANNDTVAAESIALELPQDTQGLIKDLVELFKRAVAVLGDVMRQVLEDIMNAFRSSGETIP